MISLKGKTVLITGASSGIGRECAFKAAELGAQTVLIARNKEKLSQIKGSLPGRHIYFPCDIASNTAEKMETFVTDAVDQLGQISGFIHSAGIERTIPLRNMNFFKYQEIFSINVFAGFELARLVSKKKYFDPSGASFVFMGSVMSQLGEPGKVAYSSTKAALIGGVKSMAMELAPKKIRVNCIMPGIVETEMSQKLFQSIPLHSQENIFKKHILGLGQPKDVAHLCMFLLADVSRWMTAAAIPIDGGYSAH